jgi:hypothetical protein
MLDNLPPPNAVIEFDSTLYVKSALIAADFSDFPPLDENSIEEISELLLNFSLEAQI